MASARKGSMLSISSVPQASGSSSVGRVEVQITGSAPVAATFSAKDAGMA